MRLQRMSPKAKMSGLPRDDVLGRQRCRPKMFSLGQNALHDWGLLRSAIAAEQWARGEPFAVEGRP